MRNTCPVWLHPFALRNSSTTSNAGSTKVDFDIDGSGDASRPTPKPIIVPTSGPKATVVKSQPSQPEEVIESAAAIYDAQKWRGIDRTGTRSTSLGSSNYQDSAWSAGLARGLSSISGSSRSGRSFTVSGTASRQSHLLGGPKTDCEAR
jgi:hypothetical protein